MCIQVQAFSVVEKENDIHVHGSRGNGAEAFSWLLPVVLVGKAIYLLNFPVLLTNRVANMSLSLRQCHSPQHQRQDLLYKKVLCAGHNNRFVPVPDGRGVGTCAGGFAHVAKRRDGRRQNTTRRGGGLRRPIIDGRVSRLVLLCIVDEEIHFCIFIVAYSPVKKVLFLLTFHFCSTLPLFFFK